MDSLIEKDKLGGCEPINILQLTLSFENGGRKEAINNLSKGLQQKGHSVFLGCVSHAGCDLNELIYFKDTEVFHFSKLLDFTAVKNLSAFCIKNKIQLIHAHDAGSLYLASLTKWCLKFSAPQIMTFHRSLNFETASLKNKIRNVLALMSSEGVITVSNARGQDFISSNLIKPKRLQLINLSADINRFKFDLDGRNSIRQQYSIPEKDIVFGAMGHFGLEKGIDVVINGYRILQQKLGQQANNIHLLILGRGNNEDTARLEGIIEEFGIKNVYFAGFQPNPETYFSVFDVFLHTPREENGATVLFEAMASSLPIVGSLIGGVPEAIVENETGLLVESENAEQLALAAEELLLNDHLRISMGLAGLKRCHQNFTHEHYIQKHLAFYNKVLE